MKKENLIIIILLMIIFSLFGYIIINQKQPNIETNNENNNNEDLNEIKEITSQFSGKYSHVYTDDTGFICSETNEIAKEVTEFELHKDGTYTYKQYADCGSGESFNGNFYINNEKILLINNNCKPICKENEVTLPNCSDVIELSYSINNNTIEIYSINKITNSKIIYEKIN